MNGTGPQMERLLGRARAYLAGLEADRQTALALSEQKAEEAKLIKARQEGFQAALALLGEASAGTASSGKDRELAADPRGGADRARAPADPRIDPAGVVVFRPADDGGPDRQSDRVPCRPNRNRIGAHAARRPGDSQ